MVEGTRLIMRKVLSSMVVPLLVDFSICLLRFNKNQKLEKNSHQILEERK